MSKIFCSKCGNEMNSSSSFCDKCGAKLINDNNSNVSTINNMDNSTKTNGLAVAGFVTAMCSLLINFFGIMGLIATILSAVGLSQASKNNEKGKGLAIAGICVGVISIIFGILAVYFFSYFFLYLIDYL